VCTSFLFASCLFKKALTLQHTATWQDMIYLMIRVIISRCCNATWQCFCDPRRKFVLFQTKETCNLNSGTTTSDHAASAHSSLHIETYWLINIYIYIYMCVLYAHPRMHTHACAAILWENCSFVGWVVSEITDQITYLCTEPLFAVLQLWGGCD